MRKVTIIILACLAACFVLFKARTIYHRFSFAKEQLDVVTIPDISSDYFIGIIGDSWVAGNKLDTCLEKCFAKRERIIKIISSGQAGVDSKNIYLNLVKDCSDSTSSRKVLLAHPKYVVVIGGVNDAIKQMGKKFYTHHMNLIIQGLLANKIMPVIVSLPTINISEKYERIGWKDNLYFTLTALFTNNGKTNNVKDYRAYLYENCFRSDSLLLIRFEDFLPDYELGRIYYGMPTHLNKMGIHLMCEKISERILEFDASCK